MGRKSLVTEEAYRNKLDSSAKSYEARSSLARDIAKNMPAVKDQKRKDSCCNDFIKFCKTYFPNLFTLEWSNDHVEVATNMARVAIDGGLYPLAMPRGSGKSTLTKVLCIWMLLYGKSKCVVVVAASGNHAKNYLKDVKSLIRFTDLLYEDFPEVVHAIKEAKGNSVACQCQTYHGEPTMMEWSSDTIVLPSIPNSLSAGGVIHTAGILGAIRGYVYTGVSGIAERPSLVIVDDPQTRKTAASAAMCEERAKILQGDIRMLNGPDRPISLIMPCTVIRQGDLCDVMLAGDEYPRWRGDRKKMVYQFPTNQELWDTYSEIYRNCLFERDMTEANDFYTKNREAMDEGCIIGWEARKEDCISAIQFAMNTKFDDEEAFFAEYQNEPISDSDNSGLVTRSDILSHINTYNRYEVPNDAHIITAFIDVMKNALYYAVVAWEPNFTGYIIDYGVFPEQRVTWFMSRSMKHTIEDTLGMKGDMAIHKALEALVNTLMLTEYENDKGVLHKINKMFIDAGWSWSTVFDFCRRTPFSNVVMPSFGRAETLTSNPFSQTKFSGNIYKGLHWETGVIEDRKIYSTQIDPNYWKSFVNARFATPMGTKGSLSIFKERPQFHNLFSHHVTAEKFEHKQKDGRELDIWTMKGDFADNHWFDCVVGASCAASTMGINLFSSVDTPNKPVNIGAWKRL